VPLHNFRNPRLTKPRVLKQNGVLMSDEIKRGLQSPLRRKLLMGAAALPAMALLPRFAFGRRAADRNRQHHGIGRYRHRSDGRHPCIPATGTMAISETGSIQAEKLAIEQINAMGGVLGRKIKIIQEDGAQRLADFRGKGQEAAGQRQGGLDHGLLDLGVAQGGAAGDGAVQRHALLPHLL
jgi:urea transport system substrate-binding protein